MILNVFQDIKINVGFVNSFVIKCSYCIASKPLIPLNYLWWLALREYFVFGAAYVNSSESNYVKLSVQAVHMEVTGFIMNCKRRVIESLRI